MTAAPDTASAAQTAAPAPPPTQGKLVMPPSWLPADWDRNVYFGAGDAGDNAENALRARQNMLNTVPFTLWAVAHDTQVTEAFEPIWVWYTAIRSCERGIQLNEDLAGEFGNRGRGKATLTQVRNELNTWAATQPPEMTLYFLADLGQWNETSGVFPLQNPGMARTVKPQAIESIEAIDSFLDGAQVQLWTDSTGQAINYFQASLVAPQCVSKDGTKTYKFERMSQWWVAFGNVDRGIGGPPNYASHEMLPPIRVTREAAAALAQRNPQRKVVVAVTFAPVGSSFGGENNEFGIRAKYQQVTVTDALDGSVLVSKSY